MESMTVLEIFRMLASEFIAVSDDEVGKWVSLTEPLISRNRFGALYQQAVALLAAHRMKLAGLGENPLGNITIPGGVASYSEGSNSISYNTSQQTNVMKDAELGLTAYGTQFLTLRRSAIVPILVSGEG